MGNDRLGQLGPDFADDFVLQTRTKGDGNIVINHGQSAFISPFAEDAFRGNVTGGSVGIGGDPQFGFVQLPFKTMGVIHYNLAGQKYHGQAFTKTPGGNAIGKRLDKEFTLIQS